MANRKDCYIPRPLTTSDIPTCARIAGLAFEFDRQTQFKARSLLNPYDHEAGMQDALAYWLSQAPGTMDITVAEDPSTKSVIGWVAWVYRGFNSAEGHARRERELKQLEDIHAEGRQIARPTSPVVESVTSEKSARARLEQYTGDHLKVWMERLMPLGTKCMYISSIVVRPSHQGKGVGSALIHRGTARADEENVFCWVHASEVGTVAFERQGFKTIGKLELDLDRWNTEGIVPPDGSRWGMYTFNYMRRDAR
ncbi:uncharacterized protein MYCFIDRAFT_199934 [Pseudocercospora fijiensis CIRAD86]|uniref:N-acetyltransferase domain-containing protein n=1 Tax=Pseudocercospora fijiensis (strain CIRAD86) TaxID=383855 RepID=M3AN08_PSEFD|nr:uncharacterized protein MYCFIDRAFT_199934 [Pseudocercospora fijiensis CIRAD86]EME78827.1 hypothetical protein MYCFIDRAFT_199934 [Pseudocercospora fijiensis CIRAD86]